MARSALVTGGTGYIASHLVPALVERGWQVRSCARGGRPPSMPEEVEHHSVDLSGTDDLDEVLSGVSHVFHLAGASSSRSSDEEMWRSNVEGTTRLVEAARRTGVERFLYMSSTSVYGEEVQLPVPVPEDVEPCPSRSYGKAKWGAEQAVWRAVERGLAGVVVRPVSVFGPGNTKLLGSAILDVAVERFAGLDKLDVHREPVEQRLVHVDDVVAATLHLAVHPDSTGRAFNVCLDTYPTSHDLVGILADLFSMSIELSDDPECGLPPEERARVRDRMLALGMQDQILLSKERFRLMRKSNLNNRLDIGALTSTGFRFAHSDLPSSIASTVDWYRQHRWIL
ncbi:MAG: NAD(P)-dependent oxidoreductase [Actinobacteria bacterium]|nr:NAD(P)-dependent oxidoreductase [Actinomycetota bacterium]